MSDDQPDEGPSVPSATDTGGSDPEEAETTDPHAGDDGKDPAGVGGHPADDSAGLSGQPDAEEFESATDWSDVDDTSDGSPHVPEDSVGDSQPTVDAGNRGPAANTGTRDGAAEPSNAAQGNQAGPATGGHADAGAAAGGDSGPTQRGPGEKFCSNCGSVISEQAVVCPDCGVEQADIPQGGAQQAQRTGGGNGSDPGVAALLSAIGLLIPLATGAGQLYNGDVGKGVLFTLIQLINVGLIFLVIGFVTYPLVGIIAIWDAYSSADG